MAQLSDSSKLDLLVDMVQSLSKRIDYLESNRLESVLVSEEQSENVTTARGSSVFDLPKKIVRKSGVFALPEKKNIDSESRKGSTFHIIHKDIESKDKMQTKSIKALKWLMERYRVFSRDTVQGKSGEYKLSMFVSTTILEDAIAFQDKQVKGHYKHITMENILEAEDDDVHYLLCDMLRARDRKEYSELLYAHVEGQFEDKNLPKNFVFDLTHYDEVIYPLVSKILKQVREYDAFFRDKASKEELSQLPPETWGESNDPGAFMIVMQLFGDYSDIFQVMLKREYTWAVVKKFSSMEEFVDNFQKMNARYAAGAKEATALHNNMGRVTPLSKLREEVLLRKSRAAPQSAIPASQSTRPTPTFQPKVRLLSDFSDIVDSPSYSERLIQAPVDSTPTNPLLTEDDFLDDHSTAPQLSALTTQRGVPVGGGGVRSYTSPNTSLVKPQNFSGAPVKPPEICFKAAKFQECDGSCGRSHDPKLCQEWLQRDIQKNLEYLTRHSQASQSAKRVLEMVPASTEIGEDI